MRIIYTSTDQKKTSDLSNFLKAKGIDNQFEVQTGTDWGSPDYGLTTCHIWVIDEDALDESLKIRDAFEENPNDPQFKVTDSKLKTLFEPLEQKLNLKPVGENEGYSGMGFITLYIMITCILLFLYAAITTPDVTKLPENIPYAPVVTAPINKTLMYDYPKAYEYIDQIISTYGLKSIQEPGTLPAPGMKLLEKYNQTPYWQGLYDKIVLHFQNPASGWNFTAPLFEKIKEGEFWRLFTPALMHANFFHIVFNLILFVILGRQMESKIGSAKYLLFILLAGIFSNTTQYLMTGTGFLGISGVVCAMIGFIFVRQRIAAWEGYQFSSVSLSSVFIFIMLMFSLQIISFLVEIYFKENLSPGIANTAHLSGLVLGMVLGFTNLFKLRNI